MANARQFMAARTAAWAKNVPQPAGPKIYLYSYGYIGDPVPAVPQFAGVSDIDLSYYYDDSGRFLFVDEENRDFNISELSGELKDFIIDIYTLTGYPFPLAKFIKGNDCFYDASTFLAAGELSYFGPQKEIPYLCFGDWINVVGGKVLRCLVFDHRID